MFKRVPSFKNKSLALLPETLHLQREQGDYVQRACYTINTYWHEVSKAKHVVAYGLIYLSFFDTESKGFDRWKLGYNDILLLANDSNYFEMNETFMRSASVKLGHTKPWTSKANESNSPFVTTNYDAAVLQNMLVNPNALPPNSDGWFMMDKIRPTF